MQHEHAAVGMSPDRLPRIVQWHHLAHALARGAGEEVEETVGATVAPPQRIDLRGLPARQARGVIMRARRAVDAQIVVVGDEHQQRRRRCLRQCLQQGCRRLHQRRVAVQQPDRRIARRGWRRQRNREVEPVSLPACFGWQDDAFEAVSRRARIGDGGTDAPAQVRLRDHRHRRRQQHGRDEDKQRPHQLNLAVAVTVRPLP